MLNIENTERKRKVPKNVDWKYMKNTKELLIKSLVDSVGYRFSFKRVKQGELTKGFVFHY